MRLKRKFRNPPKGLEQIRRRPLSKDTLMTELLENSIPTTIRRIFVSKPHLPSKNRTSALLNLPEEVVVSVGDCSVVTHHGGHLQHFWQVWENLYCHPRVVQILRLGYRILLQSNPPLSVYPIIQSGYDRQEKHDFLQDCVVQMLQKDAIYHLKDCTNLGFSSRLFLVPKPDKKWRPVIDLSVLNSYLYVPTFKMETAEIIRNSLTKGEWVVSIDLKDAYFHVPIHPDSQHLLRFHVDKRTYQFKALPFGLATAPLEFTRIAKEAKLVFQSRGI